jgi:hypothetical protein
MHVVHNVIVAHESQREVDFDTSVHPVEMVRA